MKLGVLGLGKAGLRHADAAVSCDAVELVAVADTSPRARARVSEPSCAVVASLDELLEYGPDAVVVALPHGLLADAAVRAASAGAHVLLEKPMATTVTDAQRVVDAAEAASVKLMVNYNHRFRDEYRAAKRFLQEGRLGQPKLFVENMFAPTGPLPDWVWSPDIAGGGMMTYNGAHMVDHVLWLANERVERVTCTMGRFHFDAPLEDTTVATIHFTDESVASLVQHKSNVAHSQTSWETRVQGTAGALRVVSGEGAYLSGTGDEERVDSGPEQRFVGALRELAAAVEEDREPEPNGHEGVKVLTCLEALYRSASTGESVAVEATH